MGLKLTDSQTQYWRRPMGLNRDTFAGQSNDNTGATMMAWIRITGDLLNLQGSTSNQSCFVTLGSSSTNGFASICANQDNALNNVFIAEISDDGSQANFAGGGPTDPTYAIGKWICVVALLNPDGTMSEYVSNNSSPSTIIGPGGSQSNAETFDNFFIGWQSTYTNFGSTSYSTSLVNVAETAIWKGLLGTTEVLQLFAGANPSTIQPGNLYCYYPLRGDLNDHGPQHIALQPQGGVTTIFCDHPPVSPYRKTTRGFAAISSSNPSSYVYQSYPW